MREFWNILLQELKPRLHEISAYLTALTFCWLLYFHPEFRHGFFLFFTGFMTLSPVFIAAGLIVIAGLLLSLVHVFIKRKKSASEKFLIGWFILGTSSAAGFFVTGEMLSSSSSILMILPVWNILMSMLMWIQMGTHQYDISDDNASLVEVLVTTVILVAILLLIDQFLHFSWAMIYSICVFYSTSIVFLTSWFINHFGLQVPGAPKRKQRSRSSR